MSAPAANGNGPSPIPARRTVPASQPTRSQPPRPQPVTRQNPTQPAPRRDTTHFSAEAHEPEDTNHSPYHQALLQSHGTRASTQPLMRENTMHGPGWEVQRPDPRRRAPRPTECVEDGRPVLQERFRPILNTMGSEYFRRTGHNLVVTSGERDINHTSNVIYTQSDQDFSRRYTSQRGAFSGYDAARNAARHDLQSGQCRSGGQDQRALAEGVRRLVDRGQFISNHQTGDAFDLSTAGSRMGQRDIDFLRQAFESRGYRVTDEGNHLHIDLPRAPVNTQVTVEVPLLERFRRNGVDNFGRGGNMPFLPAVGVGM